jgi:hypothetical protein
MREGKIASLRSQGQAFGALLSLSRRVNFLFQAQQKPAYFLQRLNHVNLVF